jgi:hypothetical protein
MNVLDHVSDMWNHRCIDCVDEKPQEICTGIFEGETSLQSGRLIKSHNYQP